MLIRKLVAADVRAYRTLRVEVIRAAPTAFGSTAAEEEAAPDERFLADIAPPGTGCVIGAFDGTALIGVAGLRAESKRQVAHKGLLFGMAIRPAAQRRGVGRALVQAVLDEARRADLLQLVLAYSAGNLPAEQLYRACGFVEFGREPRAVIVDGVAITRVHMVRMLDDIRPPR